MDVRIAHVVLSAILINIRLEAGYKIRYKIRLLKISYKIRLEAGYKISYKKSLEAGVGDKSNWRGLSTLSCRSHLA